jgi:alanine racemase
MSAPAQADLSVSPSHRSNPRPAFYRPCWVDVDLRAFRRNFKTIQKRLHRGVQVLAVVKANGYGHGLLETGRTAVAAGAAFLGVSSLEEGVALRESGLKNPILILGSLYPFTNFPVLLDYKLTPTVASVETAEALDAVARRRRVRWPVHLKIDSGFGRIGVSIPRAMVFIQQVAERRSLEIQGLFTHFASSDIDSDYTRQQTLLFKSVVQEAARAGVRTAFVHLANSAAILRDPQTHGNLVRPGLSLYGIAPYAGAEKDVALEPALTWRTRVIFVKTVPAGVSVSYARTWTSRRKSRIATLAFGYADGYPRLLSNRGHVLIRGRRLPIVGRVTMDMSMVDATDLPECRVGDEAVLLGRQGGASINVSELAEGAQTNSYEIVSRIAARVPRFYGHA